MKEYIKSIFKGQLFTTIVYLALGIWLVSVPLAAVNIICKVIFGIVLMLVGLYHIWLYLSEAGGTSIFNLFTGAIMLVLGVFFFQNPMIVEAILPTLLAALILVDSIWTLRTGLKLKQHERGEWKIFVIVSLIFITLGIILFINPFTILEKTVVFAGWCFISDAVLDVCFILLSIIGSHAIEKKRKKLELQSEESEAQECTENITEEIDLQDLAENIVEEIKDQKLVNEIAEDAQDQDFELVCDYVEVENAEEIKVEDSVRYLFELDENALEEWKD